MTKILKLTTKLDATQVDEFDLIKEILERMVEAFGQQKVLSLTDEVIKQIKGETGDKGETGEQGDRGFTGGQGNTGETGKDGKKGRAGLNGLLGEKGKQGEKGDSGISGKNSNPDSPLDITKKLNTLKEKVDIEVIKGLLKRLNSLEKIIQDTKRIAKSGGGGGQGNVIHDQFDGDGSTTSFTLSNNVAGAGQAVYACRYEGQVQFLGDQYTISGKTLNFTFTPELNTKIEITYSRG